MQSLVLSLLLSRLSAIGRYCRRLSFVSVLFFFIPLQLQGQTSDRIMEPVDAAVTVALPNQHPQWATPANVTSDLSAMEPLENLTLVLARSPQQERDLQTLLAEQQDLASPLYHQWLTPMELGARFGLSPHDIATITNWLQSQGLHVRYVSPSRTFIGFGGAAAAVASAFHTTLHNYATRDAQGSAVERLSIATAPHIPVALVPAIQAITGLYTVVDHPLHTVSLEQSQGPRLTVATGENFITPQDFVTIYDAGSPYPQTKTIGIVGEARTDFSDFSNFRQLTQTQFPNPIEIVPTAYGGIDPGPALATPPAAGVSLGAQSEATLDVLRAGSVSNNAQVLLVVATPASGGVEADAQYLIESTPLPAQVLSISFGACESAAGPAGVNFWNTLFQQAAAEGISAFVSSGDSGAAGCDADFTTPPTTPVANSPNYICSSSYATCVGGTEFNDASDPSLYWNASNVNVGLESAEGYIPEGGWNEPLGKSNSPQISASGGGVSSIIPTPAWQIGPGVPAARTGRYTPDIAFSAAKHDGYFGCFAAVGASCVVGSNGSFTFGAFAGTSAAAPSMAGVAALLNAHIGTAQGNLTPQLYPLAVNVPAAFHDITVASSGVTGCAVTTPSLCNNSIPGATAQAASQPGYLVTTGYDLVTGLGSLDVNQFLINYPSPPNLVVSPLILTFATQFLNYPAQEEILISNFGTEPVDNLTLTITGANASEFVLAGGCDTTLSGNQNCQALITFTPAAVGVRNATFTVTSSNAAQSPQVIPLTGTGTNIPYTPVVSVSASPNPITVAQGVRVAVSVLAPQGAPADLSGPNGLVEPLGSVVLTSGTYSSSSTVSPANQANAQFNIAAGVLPLGANVFTATYTPSAASATLFTTALGSTTLTVTPVPPAPVPSYTLSVAALTVTQGQYANNTTSVEVSSINGYVGMVALTAAITSSPSGALSLPTLSLASNSINLLSDEYPVVNLTVTTKIGNANISPAQRGSRLISWYGATAVSFAWLIFVITPARSRRWRAALGSTLLFLIFAGGTLACGGASGTTNPTPPSTPGTTPGSYVVTVTGTSGTLTQTATATITVNKQ